MLFVSKRSLAERTERWKYFGLGRVILYFARKLYHKSAEAPWAVQKLVRDCTNLLGYLEGVSVSSCPREVYRVADWVAKAHRNESFL